MKSTPTFKRALSDAIYAAHRLRDMSKSKTKRFRKNEMQEHLRSINILRQEYSEKFNIEEQKRIKDYVPFISNSIDKGRYEAIDVFAEELLDIFTTKTMVSIAKPYRSKPLRITSKTPRITPKRPKLRG